MIVLRMLNNQICVHCKYAKNVQTFFSTVIALQFLQIGNLGGKISLFVTE